MAGAFQANAFQNNAFQTDAGGGGTSIRALIVISGVLRQITDAEVGTGKKPVVLLDGTLKERTASEGLPIVYDAGDLRTIASGEILLI